MTHGVVREVDLVPRRAILHSMRVGHVVALLTCLVAAAPLEAAPPPDSGPWLTALGSTYVLLDLSTGDLDGDGRDETVACYREDLATTDQSSGVVVLQGKGTDLKPVFHVQLYQALCDKVRVNGRKLGVLLSSGAQQLVWTYGEDLFFRGDKRALVVPKSVTATSTTGSANAPARAFDNDISTSWAEGAEGTGIGQSITVKLERALDIGAVGIFCGNGAGPRPFFDHNRLHRGSVEVKTEADLGDENAGFDFSSLGIDSIGDRVEFSCENRPEITYVHLGKRGVVELTVRIDSVYLGDKKDDTHIAEVEIVPRLARNQTLDKATPTKKPKPAAAATEADDDAANSDVDVDGATTKLDDGGRGIAIEDDL
jgi:hypothetical protein